MFFLELQVKIFWKLFIWAVYLYERKFLVLNLKKPFYYQKKARYSNFNFERLDIFLSLIMSPLKSEVKKLIYFEVSINFKFLKY